MLAHLLVASVVLGLGALAPPPASPAKGSTLARPAWTKDACWYQVVVPRFRNGAPSNDPPGTRPWAAEWTRKAGAAAPHAVPRKDDRAPCGGDLQGLQSRLPYLKDLGFNTLYLSSVFRASTDHQYEAADLRHVDDSLGVLGSLGKASSETNDPATWKFSASDRLFLDLVKEAHQQGFRVIVEGRFSQEKQLCAVTRRWMDPNGDGDASDGVDGWAVRDAKELPPGMLQRWRTYLRTVNRDAILVGDLREASPVESARDQFDLTIRDGVGEAIRRFFSVHNKEYPLQKFFDELATLQKHSPLGNRLLIIRPTSSPATGRLWSALSRGVSSTSGPQAQTNPAPPADALLERWRLAMVFQHLYPGTSMTYYGDEVGMNGRVGWEAQAPMWWDDLPGKGAKLAGYRRDLAALARQLNGLRKRFAPLRHGDYRTVLLDEPHRVLAFARTLPGDEAILVMNYGDTRQRVTLPVGSPGQLVGIVNPELKPGPPHPLLKGRSSAQDPTKIPHLRLGGSRQFADGRGELSLSVNPRSVRIVLVSDAS